MNNPFSVLPVDENEDISTNNLPRKLKKMKRKYEEKPTEDLKRRIDELEESIKPIPLNSNEIRKKNKKPKEEPDLDEEYRKNKSFWRKYYKNRDIQQKEKPKRKSKEYHEWSKSRQKKTRYAEKKKRQQERKEEERQEQQYEEYLESQKQARLQWYANLPQDIRDFLEIRIPDKDNVEKHVKKMYNKLCLRYHPDKGGDEEHFKVINNHIN